jgi:secreted trypsin-like serine protease
MLKRLGLLLLLLFLSAQASQLRIVGGTLVDANDPKWEFIVSVQNGSLCGGSLIADEWVLTAAHCWYGVTLDTQNHKVGVNNIVLAQQDFYNIASVTIHPNYNDYTTDNDLALIKLSTPVTGVTPVILDRSSPLTANLESWVAGWGTMAYGTYNTPTSLMQVMVPIVDFDTCNASYSHYLTENMICAGYMEGGKDACQGDSGGPLLSDTNGQWVQSGIVSWGVGCAYENYPGVYTKVQNYIAWIEGYTGVLPTLPVNNQHFLPAITSYLLD